MVAAHTGILGSPLRLAAACGATLLGLEAHLLRVEVCCTRGPASFQLVGLPTATVREARVRVASACAALGVLLDEHALTVNLAPAELPKHDASLDLALACAILAAVGDVPAAALADAASGPLLLGELGLGGELRPVRGLLPQLRGAAAQGVRRAVVPRANAREAGLTDALEVSVADTLAEVRAALRGERTLARAPATALAPEAYPSDTLASVRGQRDAVRALTIAAAGGHGVLLMGPPGAGKTLLARALPELLPPMTAEECLEATAIHSVAGTIDPAQGMLARRPFRAPHHSVSSAGLIGGGSRPRPGELSLAHHGVLFLDELPEFHRVTLEGLRQPLESGDVVIARANHRAVFPARAFVVAAANPCPCGWAGHPRRACRCDVRQIARYRARLSGPLLDRFDVQLWVPPLDAAELLREGARHDAASLRQVVQLARGAQQARQAAGRCRAAVNAQLEPRELELVAALDEPASLALRSVGRADGLTARAVHKVLRVARTIADLDGASVVRAVHVEEAASLRRLEPPA